MVFIERPGHVEGISAMPSRVYVDSEGFN